MQNKQHKSEYYTPVLTVFDRELLASGCVQTVFSLFIKHMNLVVSYMYHKVSLLIFILVDTFDTTS